MQEKKRGQTKHDYDQGSYWTRNRSCSGDRRTSFRDRVKVDLYKIIDRIIEEDCKATIEMTIGVEIIGRCKIIEVRIIEVDIETITEMTTEMTHLEEVEVGLEKNVTHVTLEGMTEAVLDLHQGQDEDQDQGLVQESVQIETESGFQMQRV